MLSVDLKVLRHGCLLVCRGDVTGAKEADYLFNLLMREDKGDVILDLAGVTSVGDEGLSVIVLAYEMLMSVKRRLFLMKSVARTCHGTWRTPSGHDL